MSIRLSKTPLPDFNGTVSIDGGSAVLTPQELVALRPRKTREYSRKFRKRTNDEK